MALFSQRRGLKPPQNPLQAETVDAPLRNLLWSFLHDVYFRRVNERSPYAGAGISQYGRGVRALITEIWCEFFKHPSDTHPHWDTAITEIRCFFFACEWNEVYDLLEFVAANGAGCDVFTKACNSRLEQENAAYRFVGSEVVPITSPPELAEVEKAALCGIAGAEKHLTTALSLLGDRKNPDYRNSVKEAISAVETVCRSFAGGTTLGDALKALKRDLEMHPAFEKSLHLLYGYTSDASGIRHSLLDASTLSFSDAKFMLVACSAFVNYLIGKAAEAGIKLRV